MVLSDNPKFKVERAVLDDAVKHENGAVVVCDERAYAVRLGDWVKCLFADVNDFAEYAARYGLYGKVCLLGAPSSAPSALGFEARPCVTFAYLNPMPPAVECPNGVEIKRLAPSLAKTVLDAYGNPGSYTVEDIADIMREKGVFGAIADGKLVGFIGRHDDGSMGMLEIFEQARRRGIGSALERFLITFVMTYGRMPYCDVYTDNPESMALQRKLGLTAASDYTFWTKIT